MIARPLVALAAFVALGTASVPSVHAQDAPAPTPIALGATIPMADAKLKNVDGRDVTIAGLKGKKGTLVIFTCNACPWAKKWESRVAKLGNDALKRGLGVVAINPNDPERNKEDGYDVMQARAKQHGMKFPYAMDRTSDVARAFGASRTPEVFLFDASGALAYHGAIDDNADDAAKVSKPYLENAIAAVTSGKAVGTAQTKALGCSIKFRAKAS